MRGIVTANITQKENSNKEKEETIAASGIDRLDEEDEDMVDLFGDDTTLNQQEDEHEKVHDEHLEVAAPQKNKQEQNKNNPLPQEEAEPKPKSSNDKPSNGDKIKCPNDGKEGIYNDNYCDCSDGSDEPHTSACSHLLIQQNTFECEDGSGLMLYPSRVGDGVVDCEDGSDEKEEEYLIT